MAISTAFNLVRMAFQISGAGAPRVLLSYLRMALVNRSYRKRLITQLPVSVEKVSTEAAAGRAGRDDKADVVIPIYDNFEDTKALLEQLRPEASGLGKIILVNDCGSDERVLPMLRSFAETVENAVLIENAQNLGFVGSCNRGFERSEGDVVVLNTDIEVPPGALGRLVAALRSSDDIATATPFSNSAYGVGVADLIRHNERPFGGSTQDVDRAFQTLSNLAPIDIPRGVGFCLAISRAALDRVGVFSKEFRQGYGEEADFCMRARQKGLRSVICLNTYVYHKAGQSFGGSWQDKARAGQLIFLKRHPNYVGMMDDYLTRLESQAAGFLGLVALARNLSGREPDVIGGAGSGIEQHAREVPVVVIADEDGGASLSLQYAGEAYQFGFGSRALLQEAVRLAGLSVAVS